MVRNQQVWGIFYLNKPFPAYKGSEPYVFVCYAHKDAELVYADLSDVNARGINLWYDEGISGGSSWRAGIAEAIQGAGKLLFFISESSLQSTHCLREIDYALNHDLDIIPVYLDDLALPAELELVLNRVQALFRESDPRYMDHLHEALNEATGPAKLRSIAKNQRRHFVLPILALSVIVLASGFFIQTNLQRETKQIIEKTTTSPNAFDRYLQGMTLMARWDKDDNLELSASFFKEAIALDPDFALAHARLAEVNRIQYALSGDDDFLAEAVTHIEKAAKLNSGLAPVQVNLGRIHAAQGNLDLAFVALEQALSLDPNDATANAAIALLYEKQGRLEDAEAAFGKSIALEPNNLLNIDAFANFLYRQNRFEDAAQQWRDVIRLAPDHFAALTNLGASLGQSGSTAESIMMYERALSIRQTYMAWLNLAATYAEAERTDDAIEAYLKAIAIHDTDWLAWGNLAYTYSYQKNREALAVKTFEKAIKLAEEARLKSPRDPYVHSDLALYYSKTGQTTLAQQRIATAIALSPETGEIQAAAAEVFELTGQRDTAIEHVKKAIILGYSNRQLSDNPDLVGLLADLQLIEDS